ncbi:P pilus assembly protein, chaperone PapD [Cylindrospermum sp. FACHB-282]|uniref:P pilus assembly protein, chaperone PapD n=1 Tax=Cylindrospermum sp. FACHB-282 TaxID=2692794 RepID=UPI0016881F3A|nr:P pilus assembly protein, chaperone PapD [Cylindrospermum sp. FACHB-282]MBD2387292.1 P pilus assembly protein, chaperone PapD [Cylindrospermum sp. FACHB-282]
MKYQISRTALRLGAWVLSGVCLFSNAAFAEVSISPLVIEGEAKRGQYQDAINITNTSNQALRARVYIEFFTYNDSGFQTVPSNASDLSPYLQFSPRELTLPPGKTRRIRLISRLAPSLPDGEYRAVVFTENLKEATGVDKTGTAINLKTRIGVTVYVRKGKLSPSLAVDRASFNDQQKQIQVLVRNSGTASARTSLNWILKLAEKVVKTGSVIPSSVIAGQERNLLLNFPDKDHRLAPGNYQLSGELTWGENNNKSKLPFNINVTVPPQTAGSPEGTGLPRLNIKK